MSKKHIKFMCTAFRDGFQSVYGARVLTKDFLPAVEAAKDAGINYFEAGGGARCLAEILRSGRLEARIGSTGQPSLSSFHIS